MTLTGVAVTDLAVGDVTCPVTTLAPGEFMTCTAEDVYLTTQPQVDAGEVVNTADVAGTPPVGDDVTDTDTLTIPAVAAPSVEIVKSADVTQVNAEDDPVSYSFVVTNTGNVTLTGVAVTDLAVGDVTCPVTTLAPGEFTMCTADNVYLTTQPQVDAGSVINTADVAGAPPVGDDVTDDDTLTIPAIAAPSVDIVKSADATQVNAEDDPIEYSFLVTNTGNVTLTDVGVTDAAVGTVTCPVSTLAPGEFTTCTADNTYLTTQPQVDAGSVNNTADAAGTPPVGDVVTNSDTLTIPVPVGAGIDIVKSADVTQVDGEDDPIEYSFLVTNTGNVTLTDVGVTDAAVGTVSCPVATLAPGEFTTCTADNTYLTTQPQVDAGEVVNTADVSGTPPVGDPVAATDTLTITAPAIPNISLDKSSDTTALTFDGQVVPFEFLVTNTGNVTLANINVVDLIAEPVTCPVTELAPGEFTTCTAEYIVDQDDVDAGSFMNTATAFGTPPVGDPVSDTDTVMTPSTQAPSIDIVKSADVTSVAAEDDPISYSFLVTNTGNVSLTAVAIDDQLAGPVTCPSSRLVPGDFMTCTADAAYLTTQTEIDNGGVINTATVQGTPPNGGDPVEAFDTVTVPAAQTGGISLVKSADVTQVNAEDDPISYSFLVTNEGNVTLTAVAVTDLAVGTVTCPDTTLAPGASTTCTADNPFLATQTQIDAGEVVNVASVRGTPPVGDDVTNDDTLTIPAPSAPSIDIDKSSTTTALVFEDQVVPFEFLVTNDGNVTLTDVGVEDPQTGPVICPVTTLAPGESTTCTADYIVTQDDVDTGSFENTATAAGTPPVGDPVDATDTVTTPSTQTPTITVVKSADVTEVNAADDPVNFSFEITNTGNVTLSSLSVTDPMVGTVSCPVGSLPPGLSTTCTADNVFLTTQPQLDAGEIVNGATVEGTPTGGSPVTGSDQLIIPAPAAPAIELVKASTTTELTFDGQIVPFTFTVTNTGNVTLDTVNVDDPLTGPVECLVTTLAPGESVICTADYTVDQDDVDAGRFENTAIATGTPPVGDDVSDTDSVVTPAPAGPAISVDKLDPIGVLELDETIEYSFIVQNLGNVTLTDIAVDDPTANPVTCPTTTLPPNETTTCTASYIVTQVDIDAGQIVNTAEVAGTPPLDPPVTGDDQVVTPIEAEPSIDIVKSSTTLEITTADQVIPFTFEVTNTGNVTLSAVSVVDPLTGPVGCPVTLLAPGASTTCTATYSATQSDVDAGLFVNTATATGTPPVGDPVEASDSVITPAPQGPALLVDKQAPTGPLEVDATISYAIRVVNAGNVTVTNLDVDDPTAASVTCPATTLAPGGSTICNATYVVTQDDIDAGVLVNVATGTADTPAGPVSDDDTETTDLPQNPQLSLVKRTTATLDAVDQLLPYTFDVTNVGNVTFTGLTIDDALIDNVSCPITTLAPGATTTCTGTYLVTQDDIDAGRVVNVATASANDPSGDPSTATGTETTLGEQSPDITLEKQAPIGMLAADEDITYFFEVTNSGNVTLTNIAVADDITTPVVCNFTTLLPGDSTQCSATYTVTQDDLDAGEINNTAIATGTPPTGDDVSDTSSRDTVIPVTASVVVDKGEPSGVIAVDQTITYPFEVTNTGNVTLTGISIDDPIANPVTCATDTLAPGETTTCSADYVVTQSDVDAGEIVNRATVTAQPPAGPPVTGVGEETTPIEQNPSVAVSKNSPAQVMTLGATVTYTFDVLNTGDVTLTDIVVTDSIVGLVTCDDTELAPGVGTTCSGDYVVTQADIDAGNRNNQASVAGTPPSGEPVIGTDEIDTAIPQTADLTVNKQSSAATLILNDEIEFTFDVTNTGNVTLNDVFIDDPLANPVTCPVDSLAPGEGTTCRATYIVTQDDVDVNLITNTATASGTPPGGVPVTTTGTEIIEGNPDPSVNVDKVASSGPFVLDAPIDYSFIVTNTGNQTLIDIVVDDPLVAPVDCPLDILGPGEVMTCTATYLVTQEDVDAGTFRNTATVEATDPPDVTYIDGDVEVTDIEQSPSISVDKQAPSGALIVGEQVTYPFVVTNDGTVTLTNVRVDDPLTAPVTCGASELAPGGSTTCTGVYVVTQADVNAGEIVNTATVTGDTRSGSTTGTDTEITPIAQTPQVTLDKTGPTTPAVLGQVLTYELVVTNTGNVSLTDVTIDDPLTADEACPRTSLEPGESMTCTASYEVIQDDIEAGFITNTATATAIDPNGEPTTDQGESTSPAAQSPAITVDKESTGGLLLAGEPISYSFVVANIGTVTLTDIAIADPLVPNVTCAVTTLAPNEETLCSGIYVISQDDVDAGLVINEATVSGTPPSGIPTTGIDRETTTFDADPALSLNKLAPVGDVVPGGVLTWTFEATNNGNVTLFDLAIEDPTAGTVSCPSAIVSPGTTTICTATSIVTQADIDAGEIVNVATATATDPGGTPVQAVATVTQPIEQNPELLVVKSSDASLVGVDDEIPFTIDVENVGNVTLANVQISDPLAPVTCPTDLLAPGESMTCIAVLTVTQEMVDSGDIINTATARAVPPSGTPVEQPGTETVTVEGFAELTLLKEGPPFAVRAGTDARYRLTVTNTGAVTVSDIVVSDPITNGVTCPLTVLVPGEAMTCTALYRVTFEDEARGMVRNDASVTGVGPTGQQPGATASVETPTLVTDTRPRSPEPFPTAPPAPDAPAPLPVIESVPAAQPPLAQTGSGVPLSVTLSLTLLAAGGVAVVTARRRKSQI